MASEQTKLEEMRNFYEFFPYPGRLFLLQPDISASIFTHAGFSAALVHRNFAFCGKLVDKRAVGGYRTRFDDSVFRDLSKHFPYDKRILSVGCGTDEPLLLKKLHPQNEIVGIDLSARSLQKAKLKLWVHHVKRFIPNLFARRLSTRVSLICGDATELLPKRKLGQFDHIQCFGVLHHQPSPELLFEAMARTLVPGGTLRLMIYSHAGRKLERSIQRRYLNLFAPAETLAHQMKIRFEHARLLLWQLGNRLNPFALAHQRFRYLGLSGVSVADALMHPSDPGLEIEKLVHWAQKYGLKFVYCEAKTEEHGWIRELVNVAPAVQNIVSIDKKEGLLSNFVCILKKDELG